MPLSSTRRQALPAAAACFGLVTGCAQTVAVDADFPAPLVEAMPVTVGVRYTPELVDFTYVEDLPGDVSWTFRIGPANRQLFERVLGGLFAQVVPVEGLATPPGLAAVIEPEIKALEFSLPRQSRSEVYGVWIRYNLRVLGPDGALVANWPISAYGESDSRMFKGSRSMEVATVRAMRDAAATVVAGFATDPDIRKALLEDTEDEALP